MALQPPSGDSRTLKGKRAKDFGSAAVMLSLALAAGTWISILAAHFLR